MVCENLYIVLLSSSFITLNQIARIAYNAEEGLIGWRDLKPTITVQAEFLPGATGNDAATKIYKLLAIYRNALPAGYRIDIGGALERSDKGLAQVQKIIQMMIILIAILLMFPLQNVSKMLWTFLPRRQASSELR